MKKLLLLFIAVFMALTLTACEGKGVKHTLYAETWEGDNVRYAVDFYYPEDADIELEGDEEYPNWIDIHHKSENITIEPALFEDTIFDSSKEYDKEQQETYKEFKINGYDCYGYEAFGGYWIYVHLEEVSETTDRYMIIDTEVIDYSKDYAEGIAQYENPEIKKIIESFKVQGVIEYPPEEESK